MRPRAVVAFLLCGLPVAAAAGSEDPVPLDLQERVRVQLVLIDALVLDRRDRTVAGLTAADFDLLVDHDPVPIDTFDVYCPAGPQPDARVGEAPRPPLAPPPEGAPRYVFVFDYYHLERPVEALESAARAFERLGRSGESTMVMSLGEVLRIEQPFTDEPQAVLRALERMKHDLGLYFGNYGRLTERRFFHRILALFDVLEQFDGRKSVVLFSGPFLRGDPLTHDPTFREVSAMATRSRTAIYTVDAGGLRTAVDPNAQPSGGPPLLRRLALETGGRPSAETNDLGLGFARAQRDAGCRYTLGFYDERPRLDRPRDVRVFVRRPGHRVVHPTFYSVSSDERSLRAHVVAARMLPEMYEADGVAVDVLLLRPSSAHRWQALLAVEVAPELLAGVPEPDGWEVRGELRRPNGTRIEAVRRELALRAGGRGVVAHTFGVRPGRYRVGAILSHPDLSRPLAAQREVEIPEVPQGGAFLVGPLLGRSRVPDAADPLELEPSIAGDLRAGEPLTALATVCLVGRENAAGPLLLERALMERGGRAVREPEPRAIVLDGPERVRCTPVVDRLPTAALPPGSYVWSAVLTEGAGRRGSGRREFHLQAPGAP